jgi:hypothetical protein
MLKIIQECCQFDSAQWGFAAVFGWKKERDPMETHRTFEYFDYADDIVLLSHNFRDRRSSTILIFNARIALNSPE